MKASFKKILTSLFISFIILSIVSAACTTTNANTSQETAGKKPSWTIKYIISGGFAGIHRELTINSSGHLTAKDQKLKKDAAYQVSQKQLGEIINILEKLNYTIDAEGPSKLSGRCADCFIHTLRLIEDNRKGGATLNDLTLSKSKYAPLIRILSAMLNEALKD